MSSRPPSVERRSSRSRRRASKESKSSARSRRGSRRGATQFDDSQKVALRYAIIGVGVLIVLATAAILISAFAPRLTLTLLGGGIPRRAEVATRNIDMWAIYPDDSLRFATLYYPDDNSGVNTDLVDVATPLVLGPDSIIQRQLIGGEELTADFLEGSGADQQYIYESIALERELNGSPYGLDVRFTNPPYALRDAEGHRVVSLGVGNENPSFFYDQVIVAVALPTDAQVISLTQIEDPSESIPAFTDLDDITFLEPYRRTQIGGWRVFYFDVTQVADSNNQTRIAITYTPGSSIAPTDFDVFEVDRRR
ncbi:MAG: hypothetical protein GYB68_18590 [Chloroflexi bacterium]|nr:hypothetical protein [Chloroflexota bacterium]